MQNSQELLNTLILTRLSYYHLTTMVSLYRHMGSATAIVEQRADLGRLFPNLPHRLIDDLGNIDAMRRRAEEELAYDEAHGVRTLCLNDPDYPQRLKDCPDAPLLLFYKGTANLNARHIINIVGTRHCTRYGEDIIRHLVAGLRQLCPDVLIVSGLAYGVDIQAHRGALAQGMPTVAVLAHGLDNLYPPAHRDTANAMLRQGGLVTEYMTGTKPDKLNFVRRNRITAGLCDATVLVESAKKGGGLRDCGAGLITSAEDLVNALGWQDELLLEKARHEGIARELFPNLSADEQSIVNLLRQNNDLRQDIIATRTGLPMGNVIALLFQLEMKGVVKPYAGGTFHLL